MSATLAWEPVVNRSKTLSSRLLFALREALGEPIEWTFSNTAESKAVLRGISAGTEDGGLKREIKQLLEAIEKHGAIRVWEER